MRYRVLDSFTAKTPQGDRKILPGQVITIDEAKAQGLIEKGKIGPLPAYRVIQSKVVNDTVYLTDTDESVAILTRAGIRGVYSAREVGELKGLSQESLIAHHLIKKTFPGSVIEKGQI